MVGAKLATNIYYCSTIDTESEWMWKTCSIWQSSLCISCVACPFFTLEWVLMTCLIQLCICKVVSYPDPPSTLWGGGGSRNETNVKVANEKFLRMVNPTPWGDVMWDRCNCIPGPQPRFYLAATNKIRKPSSLVSKIRSATWCDSDWHSHATHA